MHATKSMKTAIQAFLYFVVTAAVIAYFFPREGKFRYQFHEGKPWRYGLLTAPSDFPIYKTDEELKAERDSLRSRFKPYFRVDERVTQQALGKLKNDYVEQHTMSTPIWQYLTKKLSTLYADGIVSAQDMERMTTERHTRVRLIKNSVSTQADIKRFHSEKSAYELIINEAPESIDRGELRASNFDKYLLPNVTYDAEMSDKALGALMQKVTLSTGVVQAGERIVDRGEVVDGRTYNILRSLKIVHETKSGGNRRDGITLLGQVILILGIMTCCALYFLSFRPELYFRRKNRLFILTCILVPCLLSELSVRYDLLNIYILPFAIIPIVVRTFFDSHTALFTHLVTALICSLVAPFPHEFLLLQIMAGVVFVISLKELSQRSQLLRCAFFISLTYMLGYIGLSLYQDGDFNKIDWRMGLYFGINFVLLMFSYVLIYMMEKAFGYVSPITLVELSNINTPLLKKLSETCAGTFQHSLQVSILASAASTKIGADTQLVRTGALYHDIGKMTNPAFFTENQTKGVNPHRNLPYEQSAQIIISHVTEGIKMAEKAMLPKAIIDFIRTHHGEGKAKYFYNSYCNAHPGEPVDESLFSYPGPNPFTKETAILMMADSVEAASRSLNEYTDETIRALVDKIIDGQIADGLLRNAPLTFRDIDKIKTTFIEKLKTMYHTRISYPDLKK
ncbi:hydrolase [Tannerella sp. oral taxon 808]|nr:hydrolase [Tannerella sp. oral taxon 808]PNE29547.1 hydrolase [Tannerella sp. oral taxon 808]